jgi:hypothetical protein
LKVAIWGYGAALAGWRKRWGCTVGFSLACFLSAARALIDAELPLHAGINYVAYAGTVCAGFIVASFLAHQPPRSPRPARWTP